MWNTYVGETSPWYADDVVVGCWVTIVAWAAGPIIRKWQSVGEAGERKVDEMRRLAEDVRELTNVIRERNQP